MIFLYWFLGLVLVIGIIGFLARFTKSDYKEIKPDSPKNYSCLVCKDGEGSHSEQICSECGRQLDPFMNA